jgi:glyoxylase-like metal-dependent hydrolase (beta-lactamase superfamily II)
MDATNGLKETTRVTAPVASNTLGVNVFTVPGKAMVGERPKPFGEAFGFDPITSTLIFGEYDAVLVDAMTTVAEAEALAHWVALHNRNLETIYITHAHFDHFYGLSILLDRFPGARAIATPKTVNAMEISFTPTVERLARRLFPGQVATKLIPPQPYEHDTFTLEGHELRIIEQGHTDSADTTSLYVPSIGLIVAGDVVYNQCRMYVGDTIPREPKELDRGAGPVSGAEPGDGRRRSQEDWCARLSLDDPGHQALPAGLRSGAENREVRPGAVRPDDGAVPALGSQSGVVDVPIPAAISFINGGGPSVPTLEETVDRKQWGRETLRTDGTFPNFNEWESVNVPSVPSFTSPVLVPDFRRTDSISKRRTK